MLLLGTSCFAPVRAADNDSSVNSGTPTGDASVGGASAVGSTGSAEKSRSSEPEPTSPSGEGTTGGSSLAAGVDVYAGVSNLEGQRQFKDGFWIAGSGLAYPSNVYLRWRSRHGSEAKIAFGVGKMYYGPEKAFDQPVEAWFQKPFGKVNVTAGKYYVPFAIQEWEYETKWGVMVQGDSGPYNLAVSANYDEITRKPNAYLRLGRNFGESVNVGISLAAGKGLSYGSIHDRAVGLDVTATWRGFQVLAEYMAMRREAAERFRFGYAKLSYEKLGKITPFIARFSWNDTTDELGKLDSTSIGLTYQLTPSFALEGGRAFTSDDDVWWLQAHLTAERALKK